MDEFDEVVYVQDEEEDEEETEQEEDDDDDDDDEDEEEVDSGVVVVESRSTTRVSRNDASSSLHGGATVAVAASSSASAAGDEPDVRVVEERGEKRRRGVDDDARESNRRDTSENEGDGEEWNRGEIEGLFCSICMEAWTSEGEHHVCCLPCGHVYGMSCIKKWIQQSRSLGKCPQCKVKCKVKDIRKIYASRIVVVDEESQKRIRYLEAQCETLKKKDADFSKRETKWRNTVANLQSRVQELTEKTSSLEHLLDESLARSAGAVYSIGVHQEQAGTGKKVGSAFCRRGSHSFILQKELRMEGSRLFEIDASNQIVIIARKLSPMGMHAITKMSLMSPYESEDILLPSCTKAVKDLRLSTSSSPLALIASLGKTLSVLSLDTNNTILSYGLPVPAWSCSWDLNNSQYMYAGLQNGMLLVFDMRQTSGPVQSMNGFTSNPIHSIHSLSYNPTLSSGERSILTASSTGISHWSFGGTDERKFLIPETENQGVCISLAYCPRGDDIVATFRPKVENSFGIATSQPALTPVSAQGGVHGSRVMYSRVGSNCYQILGSAYAVVDKIRLPKSTIINLENQESVFASGDELTHELVMQDLPSFSTVQRSKPHRQPIRDVKCAYAVNQGLVGCLSEDTLQLFRGNLCD